MHEGRVDALEQAQVGAAIAGSLAEVGEPAPELAQAERNWANLSADDGTDAMDAGEPIGFGTTGSSDCTATGRTDPGGEPVPTVTATAIGKVKAEQLPVPMDPPSSQSPPLGMPAMCSVKTKEDTGHEEEDIDYGGDAAQISGSEDLQAQSISGINRLFKVAT